MNDVYLWPRLFVSNGPGGQRQAEKELGWNRGTIRKGRRELSSNLRCADAFSARGRKKIEEKLPHLCEDIKAIVDAQTQIDPSFAPSTSLYPSECVPSYDAS